MFSNSLNPIKRLTDSLAQTKAQEHARQQRLRSQQRSVDGKTIFDASETAEAALSTDGEETEQAQVPSEEKNASPAEAKPVTTADIKDTSLPKEIRIKLAKLAKYEDRHPSTKALQSNNNKHRAASRLQREPGEDNYV